MPSNCVQVAQRLVDIILGIVSVYSSRPGSSRTILALNYLWHSRLRADKISGRKQGIIFMIQNKPMRTNIPSLIESHAMRPKLCEDIIGSSRMQVAQHCALDLRVLSFSLHGHTNADILTS